MHEMKIVMIYFSSPLSFTQTTSTGEVMFMDGVHKYNLVNC